MGMGRLVRDFLEESMVRVNVEFGLVQGFWRDPGKKLDSLVSILTSQQMEVQIEFVRF